MAPPTVTDQSPTEPLAAGIATGFEIDPANTYLLQNRTRKRIVVRDPAAGELVLAPLAERVVCGTRLEPFEKLLVPLRQRHQLSLRQYRLARSRSRPWTVVVWMALLLLIAVPVFDIVARGTLRTVEALVATVLSLAVIVVVLTTAASREQDRRDEELRADSQEGDIDFGIGGAFYDGNETLRHTKYILTLMLVVIIGAILPAIAIFVATDAKDFLVMRGGLRVVEGKESRLVSRIIQVTYTAVLALFPALLFFQFDRERVGTMRAKWVRAIFRMDHRMETLADVNARYGDELAEASTYSADSVRFLGGRHSPIIVATILVSLGWTLLVIRTESFDFAGATKVTALAQTADAAAQRASDAASSVTGGDTAPADAAVAANAAADQAAQASQAAVQVAAQSADLGVTPVATTAAQATGLNQAAQDAAGAAETAAAAESAVQQPFFQLLVPTPNAATMAFLGAYFFGVYLILRCYFRGDLRPKIYNQITARLVTVVVLAYLLNVIFANDTDGGQYLWLLSFLAGVVPTTVLQRIGRLPTSLAGRSTKTTGLGGAFAQAFATPRPLTQIDGIDLQESSRLESEGIADVTALAKADLVSVMVNTRLPVERLIDWIDQAVLVLLLDNGKDDGLNPRVVRLRAVGVRTASGVLAMATRPAEDPARMMVAGIVATETGVGKDGAHDAMTLDQLATVIEHEPAMGRILQWYSSEIGDVHQRWQTIYEPPLDDEPVNGVHPSTNGHSPVAAEKAAPAAG